MTKNLMASTTTETDFRSSQDERKNKKDLGDHITHNITGWWFSDGSPSDLLRLHPEGLLLEVKRTFRGVACNFRF